MIRACSRTTRRRDGDPDRAALAVVAHAGRRRLRVRELALHRIHTTLGLSERRHVRAVFPRVGRVQIHVAIARRQHLGIDLAVTVEAPLQMRRADRKRIG